MHVTRSAAVLKAGLSPARSARLHAIASAHRQFRGTKCTQLPFPIKQLAFCTPSFRSPVISHGRFTRQKVKVKQGKLALCY